jgi:serine/threonine-protein kinase
MGPLPVDLALYWLTSISSALAYAWNEHQLIHRDLKPDNLLVDDAGMIKLADFGIALRRSHDAARLTQEGLTMGSVHYMAPEQIQGVPDLDVRADLYSLGATFYKLLSGLPPLDAEEPVAILQRKLSENPPSIGKYRSSLPEGLVDCIDGLLARDRDKRPQDPETLSRQLMEITAAEGIDLSRVHKHYHLPDVM